MRLTTFFRRQAADGFDSRRDMAHAALSETGFDPDYRVWDAIQRLVDENTDETSPDGFTIEIGEFFTRHDLCHIFADAVTGTWPEEAPALEMQSHLFPSLALDHIRQDREDIRARAETIRGLYDSVFAAPIEKVGRDALKTLPLAVFGIVPVSAAPTRYAMADAEDRRAFLECFDAKARDRAVAVDIDPLALRVLPDRLPTPASP
jgi:hypothetical protein